VDGLRLGDLFQETVGQQFLFEAAIAGATDYKSSEIRAMVGNCMKILELEHVLAGMSVRGWFHVIPDEWVWVNEKQLECKKWGDKKPAMVHCYENPPKDTGGISVGGDFRMPTGVFEFEGSACLTVFGRLRSHQPYLKEEETIWSDAGAGEFFEPCHWPAE
jgi:hypothetical protein